MLLFRNLCIQGNCCYDFLIAFDALKNLKAIKVKISMILKTMKKRGGGGE